MYDSKSRYGSVSRFFHWLMAGLFLWQFISALLHLVARDAGITKFFWSAHFQLGFALLLLLVLRGFWGLLNFNRRPSGKGVTARLAQAGHLAIYVLMLVVPAIAMQRSFGSGRGFSFLGIEIFAPTGIRDEALMAPGNAAHGVLGWLLLALVIGHVVMVIVHQRVWRDGTLQKMAGKPQA